LRKKDIRVFLFFLLSFSFLQLNAHLAFAHPCNECFPISRDRPRALTEIEIPPIDLFLDRADGGGMNDESSPCIFFSRGRIVGTSPPHDEKCLSLLLRGDSAALLPTIQLKGDQLDRRSFSGKSSIRFLLRFRSITSFFA